MARLRVLGENPPPPRGNGENQLRELRDYLTRLKDELEFLMTHLGEDNFAESLATWVTDTSKSIDDINTALAGKQDTLTFDDTPTSGSDNPVKSGGIYDELQRKSNPNILTNAYFIGGGSQLGEGSFPINQRGQSSYTVAGYCIDRWYSQRTTHTLTLQSGCIHWERVNNGSYNPLFYQPVKVVQGEVYTYSILYRTTFRKLRETFTATLLPEASDWTLYSTTAAVSGASANIGIQDMSNIQGLDDTGKYIEIKAIKLELGTEQTLARRENGAWVLNEIPDYGRELYECQRYLKQVINWSDIYAARSDTTNLYFFIPGATMARVPDTLTSQKVYFYSGSNYYTITDDVAFTRQYSGIRGSMPKGSIPNNVGGSLVFASAVYISAE